MLDGVLRVLEWEDSQREVLDHAEAAYTSLVTGRLGADLGELERTKPNVAAHVLQLLASADAGALRRVVLAPETSCRLLWKHPGACDDRDFWRFLTDVLEVELTRVSESGVHDPGTAVSEILSNPRWSALGDFHTDGAGARAVLQQPVAGLVVDVDSPAAVCFDPAMSYIGMRLQQYSDPATREVVLRKLEAAMLALDVISPVIASYTRRFTLVANVLTDENSGFSSGSTTEYIGRSIFWNAHRESVDTGTLAEALVHEAIHSLLSMHQVTEPWFPFEELLPSDGVIESPWTGAKLRLEPFLQACFVWFGLVHFWSRARRSTSFAAQRSEMGLAHAREGFLKGSLLQKLSAYLPYIASEVLEHVREMQERILSRAISAANA